MCYHPKHIMIKNQYPTRAYPESFIELDVPCGHCISCLKRRQNDYATRLYRECKDGAPMWFLTLTYRDAKLPLSINYCDYDNETGELINHYGEVMLPKYYDPALIQEFRGEIISQKSSSHARYLRYECDSLSACFSRYCEITPSLNRLDVRNWLKKSRIQYERDFGEKLKFRYGFCGEYGPKGCRPHYHMIILDLTKEQIDYLAYRWRDEFGYVHIKNVPVVNEDGSNARQIVAKYVGKYISKGKFDADSVIMKDAQKGRLCNSKRFGTKPFSNEDIAYYKCFDLFGWYDTDRLCRDRYGKQPLSEEQLSILIKEIVKRNHIDIMVGANLLHMPMPRALKYHIWYIKNYYTDGKTKQIVGKPQYEGLVFELQEKSVPLFKERMVCPKILRLVQDYLRDRQLADNQREFEEFCAARNISPTAENRVAFDVYLQDARENQEHLFEEDDFRHKIFTSQKDGQ